jgi:hypothetical protein
LSLGFSLPLPYQTVQRLYPRAQRRSNPLMNMLKRVSFLVGCTFLPWYLLAQQDMDALNRQMRTLTPEQKVQLLGYMRTDIDQELMAQYQKLTPERQARAGEYIRFLKQDPTTLPRTTVSWDRSTIQFGSMEEGSVMIDSFTVTNTGKAPWLVHEVRAACDCTVLQRPEYPLMPGETAVIRVQFDSKGKAGETEAGIVLFDNSSPNARSILYIKGKITPRMR